MPEEKSGFRSCYRHPKRIAIRDCACCGRPICRECEKESGDELLCLPCKEELKSIEEEEVKEAEEPKAEIEYRIGQDRSKLDLGEMTVFDDGTVITPEPEELERDEEGKEAVEPAVERIGPGEAEVEEEETDRLPVDEGVEEAVSAKSGFEASGYDEPRLKLKKPLDQPEKKKKAPKKEFKPGGPVRQLFSALPYALLTAGALGGLWMIFTLVTNEWSQASVFTIGIAVPWVLYKGSLVKKRFGKRVWNEPPPAWMLSVTSTCIVAASIPVMEYFAFKIIGSRETVLPFSDFMQRYFSAVGWILIVGGIALAIILPFYIGRGGDVTRDVFQRKKVE